MREEITYIANAGTKFTTKEDCQEHGRKLEEKDITNKEKNETRGFIKDKYNSIVEYIDKISEKYKTYSNW